MSKKKFWFLFLMILVSAMTYNCRNKNLNSLKDPIERLFKRKIEIPQNLIVYSRGKEFNEFHFNEWSTDKYKILTVIDGNCHFCIDKLNRWSEEILPKFDSTAFKFYPIILSENLSYFKMNMIPLIKRPMTMYIDTNDYFITHNMLMEYEPKDLTFILDNNDEVVLIGDPTRFDKMEELYKKVLVNRAMF